MREVLDHVWRRPITDGGHCSNEGFLLIMISLQLMGILFRIVRVALLSTQIVPVFLLFSIFHERFPFQLQ